VERNTVVNTAAPTIRKEMMMMMIGTARRAEIPED